jgi:hypothetical protein
MCLPLACESARLVSPTFILQPFWNCRQRREWRRRQWVHVFFHGARMQQPVPEESPSLGGCLASQQQYSNCTSLPDTCLAKGRSCQPLCVCGTAEWACQAPAAQQGTSAPIHGTTRSKGMIRMRVEGWSRALLHAALSVLSGWLATVPVLPASTPLTGSTQM